MLTQFWVVFITTDLTRSGFIVLGHSVKITGFFVFQFDNFFAAFLGCHFICLLFFVLRGILGYFLLEIKSFLS